MPFSPNEVSDAEWDRLTAALNEYGIRHVAPHKRPRNLIALEPIELLVALMTAHDVRLQEAVIPLLLTWPELASTARTAIEHLDDQPADRAMRRYVAAAALQRGWSTRIESVLGPKDPIPPAYIAQLQLPDIERDFGRETLVALSAQEEALYGFNAWAGYTSLMDLFLNEIESSAWGQHRARAG